MNARLAIAAAMIAAPLLGGDGDFFSQPSLRAVIGGRMVTVAGADATEFMEWRDMPQGLLIPQLYASSGTGVRFFRLTAHDVNQLDAAVSASIGELGVWRASADFDRWPHLTSTGSRTLFDYLGNGRLAVSPAIRNAIESAAPDATDTIRRLVADAPLVRVSTQRDSDRVHLERQLGERWSVRLHGRDEMRNGFTPYSTGAYSLADGGRYELSAFEFAAPLRVRTNEAGAGISFVSKRFGIDVDGSYSRYRNSVTELLFDNPFRATDALVPLGGVLGLATEFPDSETIAATMSGWFDLSDKARLASTIQWSKVRQDLRFVPWTLNFAFQRPPDFPPGLTPINVETLPQPSLRGRVVTIATDDSLSYRLRPSMTLELRYRDHNADDITRPILFPGYAGGGDAGWVTTFDGKPVEALPVPFREQTTSADLTWITSKRVRMMLDAEQRTLRRGGVGGGRVTDDVAGARAIVRVRDGSSGSILVRWSDRRADSAGDDVLRRLDLHDRRRNEERAQWDWSPRHHESLGISASLSRLDDEYGKGTGLQNFVLQNATVETRLDVTAHATAGLSLTRESIGSDQESAEWRRHTADNVTSAGLSWLHSLSDDRLSLGVRALLSFSDEEIANRTAAGPVEWPAVAHRLQSYSFDAEYAVNAQLHTGVRFLYETYHVDDFAWRDLAPYPTPLLGGDTDAPRLLFLNTQSPNHKSYTFSLYVRMALGAAPR